MSFATTWALGKVANQYYAAGRKLSAREPRSLFRSLTEQARGFHANDVNAIRDPLASPATAHTIPIV